eukprot:TRINITY_DN30270_c0_g1_i1.p1 TRINITY_DN30270_c0_g1~~TRINITY_DN30270_c0_g1_i1.p1  ORF type:complete len:437 (+),score=57.16 TRINITY_DN30270_c0_g1_i1:54-1313(+)
MAKETVVSRVLKYEKSARWRVEGAHCLSSKPNDGYSSGKLFDIPEGYGFRLCLYMGGEGDERQHTPGHISLFAAVSCDDWQQTLMWRPQLVCVNQADESKNCVRLSLEEKQGIEAKREEMAGVRVFLERSRLETDGFMVNGTLVFELRVRCWFPVLKSSQMSVGVAHGPSRAAVAFSADMARLLKDAEGSDVALRAGVQSDDAASAEPLRAHKSLLAVRSPVFRQMFYGPTGMAETAACAEVSLSDMDHPTASLFLEFLYTGKLDATAWEDEDAVCHLLVAGHKYEVESLVEDCVSRLTSTMSEENAAERLMMADMLGIAQIQDAALEYICASHNRLAAIQSTEAFERLGQQRPQLALKIMAKMVAPAKKPAKRPAERHSLPEDLSSLTVVRLKQLCSDRGLSTSGNKQALLDRLRASS